MQTLKTFATLFLLITSIASGIAQAPASSFTGYTDINNNLAGTTFSVDDLVVTNCTDQDLNVRSRVLKITVDLGEVYTLGGLDWFYQLDMEIDIENSSNTSLLSNSHFQVHLKAEDFANGATGHPEATVWIDFTAIDDDVSANALDHFKIESFTHNLSGTVDYLADPLIRLQFFIEDEVGYHVQCGTTDVFPPNGLQVTGLGNSVIDNRITNVKFNWNHPAGTHFDHYDLEILKVEPEIDHNDDGTVVVPVDWTRATKIEVDSATEYTLTLSEGTGYYVWRVRPIGTFYDNDRADRRNYGPWQGYSNSTLVNHNFTATDVYNISNGSVFHLLTTTTQNYSYFYYEQFNEDLNWIYGRVFTEGSRQSETMTFANGLNQVRQTQTKLHSKGQVVGTQTVYDFSARPALQSLPASVGDNYLGYQPDFFDNTTGDPYSANDFDADAKVYAPTALNGAANTVKDYYSDNNEGSMMAGYIPDADANPYTRALFEPNATGRVWKQAGAGEVMKLTEDNGGSVNHNVTTQYSNVAQVELDRIFGNEAPSDTTTYKVITTDPNGVRSVAYVAKAGQTLATAIDFNADVPSNLYIIDGSSEFEVTKTLPKGQVQPGTRLSENSTTINVSGGDLINGEEATQVDITYNLTPNDFGVDCDAGCTQNCDFCWECDYTVEIGVRNLHYPDDAELNAILRIHVKPNTIDNYLCDGSAPIAWNLNTLLNQDPNYELIDPSGTDISGTNLFMKDMDLGSAPKVHLKPGTYRIYKRVYSDNPHPDGGLSYLDRAIDDLRDDYQEWTGTNNCCGDVPDYGDFECGTPTSIPCTNTTAINALAAELVKYINLEQDTEWDVDGNGTAETTYKSLLDSDGANLKTTTEPCTTEAQLATYITNLICTLSYNSNDIYNCFQIYGGFLQANIAAGEQLARANSGNNTGSGNPAGNFDPGFDLLEGVEACLGEGEPCVKMKNLVMYSGPTPPVGSAEEFAMDEADADYHYYLIWHSDIGGVNNTDLSMPGTTELGQTRYDQLQNGELTLIEIDPPGSPSCDLYANSSCYSAFAYEDEDENINPLATGFTEAQARAFLAQEFCACLDAQESVTCPYSSGGEADTTALVSNCEQECQDKRLTFSQSIADFQTRYNEDNEIPTPDVDENGNSLWDLVEDWQTLSDIASDTDIDFTLADTTCYIDRMVEQCMAQCQLPLAIYTQEELINHACSTCTTQVCTIDVSTILPNETGSYDCWQEFVQGDEYIDSIVSERKRYEQALNYSMEFAPYDSDADGSQYSDFGTEEILNEEIITFFLDSLNRNMNYRDNSTVLSSGGTYKTNWANLTPTTDYSFRQATHNFTYPVSGGGYKEAVAVINVVWEHKDNSTFPDDLIDDLIAEINVAVYCDDGSTFTTPQFYWAYHPNLNTPCPQLSPQHPAGFQVERDIAHFWFDKDNRFHATLLENACEFGVGTATTASGVCEDDYIASATFDINTTPGSGELMVEVGVGYGTGAPEGPNTYLYDTPVAWTSSAVATANAIAAAINDAYTQPQYTAEVINTSTVKIYAYASNGLTFDPTDLEITLSGTMESNGTADNASAFSVPCSTLNELLNSCSNSVVTDGNTRECPYGFFPAGEKNTGFDYDLTIQGYEDLFEDDLVDFWVTALDSIIQYRTVTPNPNFESTMKANSVYDYYEIEKDFLVNGAWKTAYVSVAGEDDNFGQPGGEKRIHLIQIGLNCKNTSTRIVYFPILAKIDGDDSSLDGLDMSTSGPITPGNNSFSVMTDMFTSIALNDYDTDGDMDNFIFTLASGFPSGTISTGDFPGYNNSSGDPENSRAYTGSVYYPSVPTINNLESIVQGTNVCETLADCDFCMRWRKPIQNIPGHYPIAEEPTCAELEDIHEENQTAAYLQACFEEKVAELRDAYRQNCLYQVNDELTLTFDLNYGHYTLYYTDRAGNLVQTVPPAGVNVLNSTETDNAATYRAAWDDYVNGTGSAPAPSTFVDPDHRLETNYTYNSIKQLIKQQTPDGGTTRFWYNAIGQLVLSLDGAGNYAYTRYDYLGRIIESGKLTAISNPPMTFPQDLIDALWTNIDFPYQPGTTFLYSNLFTGISEITKTTYTTALGSITYPGGGGQEHLRNRISYVQRDEDGDFTGTDDQYNTYYSYDPHGNVQWLIQELPEIGQKSIRYQYDLVSGNVLKVFFNEHSEEQFIHWYAYDEDNRITMVKTSPDGLTWDRDAEYEYYLHGPLARAAVGEDRLQGCDYVYTTEGYLKSMNQAELKADGEYDPGMDGAWRGELEVTGTGSISSISVDGNNVLPSTVTATSDAIATATSVVANINTAYVAGTHPYKASNQDGTSAIITLFIPSVTNPAITASAPLTVNENMSINGFVEDEFGMELSYYEDDYTRSNTRIGGNAPYDLYTGANAPLLDGGSLKNQLFNGNIAGWTANTRTAQTNVPNSDIDNFGQHTRAFHYDWLNRIREADHQKYESGWVDNSTNQFYRETFTYDPNGNITTLKRNGNNKVVNGTPNTTNMDEFTYNYFKINNELQNNKLLSVDDAISADTYNDDISDQNPYNYSYDGEGNLIKNVSEGISNIAWNILNKVQQVLKTDGSSIEFAYDAMGNRVKKTVNGTNGQLQKATFYVRDASGNLMGIYDKEYNSNTDVTTVTQSEIPLYGSKRLGIYRPDQLIASESGNYTWDTPLQTPYNPVLQSTTSYIKSELHHWTGSATANTNNGNSGLVNMDMNPAPATVSNLGGNLDVFKNLAIAETPLGDIQFRFQAITINNNSQVAGITLNDGLFLMNGSLNLKGDYNTKSIAVRAEDDPDIWYVVTGEDGIMYYHKVDMTGTGNAPEVILKNQVIQVDAGTNPPSSNQLTYNTAANQYALAAYNDMLTADANRLYIAVNTGSAIKLYEFEVDQSSISTGTLVASCAGNDPQPINVVISPIGGGIGGGNPPLTNVDQNANTPSVNIGIDLGEMHIAPAGDELAVNYFCNGKHLLHRFHIDPADATLSNAGTITLNTEQAPNISGNIRDHLRFVTYSFDYAPSGNQVYYMERNFNCYQPNPPLNCTKKSTLKRVDFSGQPPVLETVHSYTNHEHYTEVRRGRNNRLYVNWRNLTNVNGSYHQSVDAWTGNLNGAIGNLTQNTLTLNAGNTNFGLPLQPWQQDEYSYSMATSQRTTGDKQYEISDHLGNVRVVYSDKRLAELATGSNPPVEDHSVEVLSWSDFYSFGSQTTGRNWQSDSYRYGFNGHEKDGEILGTGNHLSFGDFGYSPRLAKRWQVDPVSSKYPHQSPYISFNNSPIVVYDPDGFEGIVVSGQPGGHKNKEHFLINGLDRAKAAQKRSPEGVTWLIYNDGSKENGHDPTMLAEYKAKAEELGITVIEVSDSEEIENYVNDKDVDGNSRFWFGNDRDDDKITSFYYVGHATPGELYPGYGDGGDIDVDDFDEEAFSSGCWINVTGGCNTAIGNFWEDSVVEDFQEIVDEKSTIHGSNVRVHYDGGVMSDEKLLTPNKGKIITVKGELKSNE